ncbi:S8 family serine peptidase [Terrimonas pollutisoli]|uniref:S8 family serine peptidase n=1 Tax=Terrimonas pollutisoli TaxID=3034147 RepID=UPI0023EC8EF9|nr:S8 family serine peptidase [Terrimonas sp. H1YJ31]
MKAFLFFIFFVFFLAKSEAQPTRYLVQLKNKATTNFSLSSPSAYLSQRAVERRTRYNIPIDSTDLPVPSSYISQIKNIDGVEILNISKWLNAVVIRTTDANAIAAINSLSFVEDVSSVAARPIDNTENKFRENISLSAPTASRSKQAASDYYDYGANSYNEIHLHKGEFLHNIGLHGEGLQIAMLDGGFFQYTSLKAFDSVNANAQILSTWDFVTGNANVVEDNAHGMQCFSTIAANIPGQFIGKAPKANFHLFRTEDVSSEYPLEEFTWACGAERADSIGADIISSSLGYGYGFNDPFPDYSYTDLNGDKTLSARAADMAAKKGLMMFNAAGNSGNDYWQMITTPADGDSIVAVGSVNASGVVAASSSYGPSADGRIKPDLASVGLGAMIQLGNNTIGAGSGTSFACPNIAGLATCLWQAFPEFNNMRIIRALKEAGSIYTNPDNRIGYGIPDMKKAFSSLLSEYATSSVMINNNCTATISWTSKDVAGMKYIIERKLPANTDFSKLAEINAENSSSLLSNQYQYSVPVNISAGTFYFRIRQVIDTSAAGHTDVIIDTASLIVSSSCETNNTSSLIIAPNPAIGNATLLIETNDAIQNILISVYDMKGSLVMQQLTSKNSGRKSIDLPVQKLPAGKYLLKVNKGNVEIGIVSLLKL